MSRIDREYVAKIEAEIGRLQARVDELEGVLMNESEKRDLLSKEHYRNKIAKLQAKVEALEGAIKGATEYGEVAFLGVNIPFKNFRALKEALAATEQESSDE